MGLSRYGYTGKKKRTIFRLSPDCSCGDYWADMLTAGVILCTVMNVVVIVSVSYIWYLNMERLDIIQLENEILRRRIELLNISELIDKETKEKDKHIKEIKRLRRSADFLLQYPLQQNQTQFGELSASISKTQQEIGELKKELKSSIKLIRDMATVPNSSACSYPYRLNPHSRTCVRFVRSSPLSWFDALHHCQQVGEHLVTINSVNSATWYRQQLLTEGWSEGFWIGGRRLSGDKAWRWYGRQTGVVDIALWANGEPNDSGTCMIYQPQLYYWDDYYCSSKFNFICEKKFST